MNTTTSDERPRSGRFATTHWSVVAAAQGADADRAAGALECLCALYWRPLYLFLRHRGHDAEEAEDLIQGLFAQLLEHRSFSRADPGRGHFRTFLLGCLKHYVSDQAERARRLKRGGGQRPLSLDLPGAERAYAASAPSAEGPDRVFERHWAEAVVANVLASLRAEAVARGRGELFEALQDALAGDTDATAYKAVAARFELGEGAVKMAVHRWRRRFRELFREAVARTVERPEEVDPEIHHLFRILGGAG